MTIESKMDDDKDAIDDIIQDVKHELIRATKIHGPFHSMHEGYAVILEEMDELWEEIKKKAKDRDKEKLKEEAIQVSAMCARFVLDLFEMKK